MAETSGIHHLGLSVLDLFRTRDFFVQALGWEESGYDESYPRTAVSDGVVRLTLWQVDHGLEIAEFQRRKNVGLHHLALEVASEEKLNDLYEKISHYPGCTIERAPELMGNGPRKHMMFAEPGGIRLELTWPGN